jgi:prepilin-type N-terminal cleavage/methylation domain-containing protein
MKLQSSRKQPARTAFTLIELLVVIAIIVVLVSLLMVGVFKALDTANEANTRTDITQIAAAVESFKTKYQVSYIPSRLILCKQPASYYVAPGVFKSQLHQDSFEYLTRIWPRLGAPQGAPSPWLPGYWNVPQPPGANPPVWYGIDWDNNGTQFLTVTNNSPAFEVTLEGEQCLVFFLGGIPGSGTVQGFSTSQSNPAQIGGDRVPPFFEFKSNRLVSLTQWVSNLGGNPAGLSNFYVYLDGYGKMPYAYFSSYKNANGYNRYFALSAPPWVAPGTSDCQSLLQGGGGVWPYAQSLGLTPGTTPTYWNAQTYQIISAGKDQTFGPGSNPALGLLWTPSTAGQVYTQGVPGGYDDIANFYDRLLGVPTQ